MCKTVLYSFTVILGSARNIEMLNDACMLFPVAISKKCRKSLRYSIGFSCFSDAPVAVVLSRSVARSKSVIGRRSSWISRMHPLHTLFPFQMLVRGSVLVVRTGHIRPSSPHDLYLTRFVSTKHRKDVLFQHGPKYFRCCLKRGYSDCAECWIDMPFLFLPSYWWGCRKTAFGRMFTISMEYFP